MPSATMIGLKLRKAQRIPLTRPIRAPEATPSSTPTEAGRPHEVIARAVIMPDKAMLEPVSLKQRKLPILYVTHLTLCDAPP